MGLALHLPTRIIDSVSSRRDNFALVDWLVSSFVINPDETRGEIFEL